MKYRIYFTHLTSSQFDTIEAMNYRTDKEFVTFYIGPMPGTDYVNVASYKTELIYKVELVTETTQEQREKKLKRIIKEDGFFKKLFNKLFNGN